MFPLYLLGSDSTGAPWEMKYQAEGSKTLSYGWCGARDMVLALLKTWQNRDTQVASWTGQMPQIPQDEWLAGRQVVELDCFIVIARKQQVNRRGLVYDSPQDMTKPPHRVLKLKLHWGRIYPCPSESSGLVPYNLIHTVLLGLW